MTAPRLDPYAILGLTIDASDDEVDQAFRGLVRGLHPDTRSTDSGATDDADRRLRELLDAYATLRDPIRRAAYDQAHAAAPGGGRVGVASAPLRPDPAIRVGPVHWEPPQARR